ncbi:LysR family transcriptional regulator [Bordetella trematum]|uniref:LysR family transcriptional regulator n=1 Tax=Bordetella trematum TaxID=123899 RepID=A0A157SDS0_9BORD|nr:LysR family transcriptional regulator [Bordetella trematum]SAI68519.1 LysR family transcriptional regulator [Bordetella trematum]
MVDLRRLRYFVVLAETLHFGKAALRLAIAQPPLSHQIRVLERELGAQLFERSNRRVELTSAGQALLPEARRLLEQAAKTAQVAARVERGEQGELRLGVVSTAALTQAVSRLILSYRQRWPGVRLHIEEFTTHEQLSAMVERRLDFAFVRGAQAPELPPASFGPCVCSRMPCWPHCRRRTGWPAARPPCRWGPCVTRLS